MSDALFTFRGTLETLDEDTAVFKAPHSSYHDSVLHLPRSHWKDLGRPGEVKWEVRAYDSLP